jgi:NADH-quinone oxidoreductase subunit M
VKERYHTLEINRLGGMLKQIPHLGWILGMCAMASLGLPGLAGFWGEFPAILSAYSPAAALTSGDVTAFRVYMVIAALGTVFAAAYLLWLYQRVAFGTPKEEFAHDEHVHDVSFTEYVAWVPMLVLIVVLGFFPNIIFHVTSPAVTHTVAAFSGTGS